MFKFIKFLFWLIMCFVVAYFLADIEIGGKSLKENIDEILAGDSVQELKNKSKAFIGEQIDKNFDDETKENLKNKVKDEIIQEVITDKDEEKLEKLIEKNQ